VDLGLWICVLRTVGVAAGAGLLALLVAAALVRISRRHGAATVLAQIRLCRVPLIVAAMAASVAFTMKSTAVLVGWRRGTAVVFIMSGCWLMLRSVLVGELILANHLRMDVEDNRRVRRTRTQVALLRRLSTALVVVLGMAGVLMTFPGLHAFGTSLFASAGVAGIVAGLAAQTTLANIFAGIQLVFTDAVRIDDVVVVEGEWGWIEEITLTYVVVHIWDERRLVLPTSYFISTPFQNWTRNQARVLGSVVLNLDYATPLTELRERARMVIEASARWDRVDWVLQVIDTTERVMVVRVLASACDGPTAWDLRCEIREALIVFLQENYPQALPAVRLVNIQAGASNPDGDGLRGTEGQSDRVGPNRAQGQGPGPGPNLALDLDHGRMIREQDPTQDFAAVLNRVHSLDLSRVEPMDLSRVEPIDLSRVEPIDLSGVESMDLSRVEPVELTQVELTQVELKPVLVRRSDLLRAERQKGTSSRSRRGTLKRESEVSPLPRPRRP